MGEEIEKIIHTLNSKKSNAYLEAFAHSSDLDDNETLAVLDGDEFKRGILLDVVFDQNSNEKQYKVLCIDYGNAVVSPLDGLRKLVKNDIRNMAPRCFECRMAGIQPSATKTENNVWSEDCRSVILDVLKKDGRKAKLEVNE